jgi:CRISPR-associated endonuclease Csn1
MKTRLGLDIGTNSIGWCLYEGDTIKDIGVRIFSDGRDPKSGASLAVDRRDARAMRRRRDRFIGRRSALLRVLIAHGLLPADKGAAKALEVHDPYELRVRALDERLEPHDIGRALFHLNQRRGFQSNRRADRMSKDAKDGKIASGTKMLDAEMARLGARSYAEFLVMWDAEHDGLKRYRIRMREKDADSDGGYDFYPDRKHYLAEFDAIWTKQAEFHSALVTEAAREAIHRVIFHQRNLKAQVVGKCTFAGWGGVPDDETRLPKAHPLFQQRRLYEEVNQLEIVAAGASSRKLTMDERDTLILKLRDKKKVLFTTLGKAINLKDGERFNKESENRKDLVGDEIRAELGGKSMFAGRWGEFSTDEQWTVIDTLLNEDSTEKLLDWLQTHYNLDQDTAEAVANAHLPDGHGRFGLTATTKLLEQLKTASDENGHPVTYAKAAELAGFHHSDFRDGECRDELPYYGEILAREIAPGKPEYGDADEARFGKITNPTVHIGLNQLRKLVNAIIKRYGKPDQIYVELARELKLNEKQKADYKKQLKANTDAAKKRSEFLESQGERDSGGNRMRIRIWEELNPSNILDRRCPFCGEVISAQMLMTGEAEIEHIIPYSKCLDDSVANKVIAHRHCNRDKGQNTPWQKWGGTSRWDIIQDQVARMHKSKQWRFSPDAMDRVERDGGFIARQLTDTQYLSRIAGKYLASLYPEKGERHVYAVTGRMTAMLRRMWGLNDILPDHNYIENIHSNAPKNRLDHRHHAIDAAVVGATTPAQIAQIAMAAGRAEDQNLDKLFVDLPAPWDGFRDELRDKLMTTIVSHKADHGRKGKPAKDKDVTTGRLHNGTAYGLTGRTNAKGAPLVVVRKPLLSLQPKDLTDPDRMPNRDLQARLYAATQGKTGKDFENALRQFAKAETPYKDIRRVRLTEALNVIPIRDRAGRAYKGVKGDANARFDVWRMPDGKWISSWKDRDGVVRSGIISMFDAHQRNADNLKPHPAAKRVLSLRQNDLVAVERDGGPREMMRVVKFSANGSMQLALNQESGALKGRDADPVDPFKYINTSATGLYKMKARQIRIDELGRIFDPGPRD